MSEVKYYHVSDTGLSEGVSLGRITVVLAPDYAAALAREAALREELAIWKTASRTNKSSADEYEAQLATFEQAFEEGQANWVKGMETIRSLEHQNIKLREELAKGTQDRDYCKRVAEHNKEIGEAMQQRLTASEQRNAELVSAMEMMAENSDDGDVVAMNFNKLTPAEKYPDKYRYGCMFCAGRGCNECVKLGQGEHKP